VELKEALNVNVLSKKVEDLTVEELKELIKETICEIIDSDYGLELREEVINTLRESMIESEQSKGIPIEKVKKKLNIE
jgi:hypothetical protein